MKNWKKVKLGELLTESKLVSQHPNTDKRIRVRLNLLGVEKRPNTKDKTGATTYYTRKAGQFVYGKQNLHKGAFGIIPLELDGFESSQDIPSFDIDDSCYPAWIFYFFKKGNFYLKLESLAKGVGSKRIQPKDIYELEIYLPSKEEQRKVLDEIEKAEINNNKLIKEIELQEINLFKLRTSIITDAVQGELTKSWREHNSKVETATELMNKIYHEKGNSPIKQKVKKNIPITIKGPFTLPETWTWCRFEDLYDNIEAGKSPRCLPHPAEIDQWGVIKLSAVSWGVFQEKENKTLPLNINPFIEKEIKAGDFIISRANTRELVGKSVVVGDGVRDKLLLNDKTLRINISKFIDKEFLNLSNNSYYAREYYSSVASGTSDSMKNISRLDINAMVFSIPPFVEQKEIVKKINELQLKCNQIEDEIIFKKNYSKKLIQSVLNDLLGEENKMLFKNKTIEKSKESTFREVKYNSKSKEMDLIKLLEENGTLHAEDLWKMSKYPDDIDSFYAELKKHIEELKSIKESSKKGYLELV